MNTFATGESRRYPDFNIYAGLVRLNLSVQKFIGNKYIIREDT